MEDILYYLLRASVGTAVFYITYHFLFRKSKQFVFNRLYLAGSFLASFIIPLITFKRKLYITETTYSYITAETTGISETMTYVPETAGTMSLHQYLLIIYFAGAAIFLSRLAYSYIVAARIKANSTIENIAGMDINISRSNIRAFTFLDRIVIGQNILRHPSLNMVLVHEAVHSREKHFIDILASELLFMLQWFNPFAWLKRKAIRNNLEFRADEVVARSFDPHEYQLAMLSMAQNRVRSPLFIELNSSNLKKRIIMMKSNRHNRFFGIARLVIIPVTAILLLSLSGKETVIIRSTENAASQIDFTPSQQGNIPAQTDFTPLQQGNIASQIDSAPLRQGNIPFQTASAPSQQGNSVGSEINSKAGSVQELRRHIAENIRYPREAAESGQMGHVSLYAEVNSDGKITEITTSEPSDGYVDIDEIFITSRHPTEIEPEESTDHEILIKEGRRVVNSLPVINIPELRGKNAKFNFRFVLHSAGSSETSREIKQSDAIQEGSATRLKRHNAGGQGQLLPMAITWPRHSHELANFDEVRRYLQYYMRYPVPVADAGKQGSVVIYGRINHEGWVEDASEQILSANYIDIGEPVVFGGTDGRRAYTSEPGLVREGKNLLLSLPRLDIPEIQGEAIKVTFRWGLYNK